MRRVHGVYGRGVREECMRGVFVRSAGEEGMRQAIANKLLAYLLPNNFALILILMAVRHLLTLLLHTMWDKSLSAPAQV
jgi:hypothetical protein